MRWGFHLYLGPSRPLVGNRFYSFEWFPSRPFIPLRAQWLITRTGLDFLAASLAGGGSKQEVGGRTGPSRLIVIVPCKHETMPILTVLHNLHARLPLLQRNKHRANGSPGNLLLH